MLECKYHELYTPLYTQRTAITAGEHEPTDVEAEWPSDSEDEEEGLAEEVGDNLSSPTAADINKFSLR